MVDIGPMQFKDINCDKLEEEADDYLYKLKQLPKEIGKWEVVNYMKNSID